ncbi:MAG: Non-motile and phage-resistance protein [candidate division WS6 bacterium OLB20]|uniref:histidine kinase n=1 Tax=candidate division WS6 bacterium OLB20 TaxID=1617426 RepID=A0A136LZY7_9BACT|nr:MAG: Non-motile and phage-resistance protein [candidate division WS6 bacterium OLB20]
MADTRTKAQREIDRSVRNIRLRVVSLIIITLLPIYGLILVVFLDQRNTTTDAVRTQSKSLVTVAVENQERYIVETESYLQTLAQLPVVRHENAAECNRIMAGIMSETPLYTNLGVADLNGDIYCSGFPLSSPVNIADRQYFSQALSLEGFSFGHYQIGRVTGKPSVNFGYPIRDDAGEISGIVFAALDLAWFAELAQGLNIPENSTLTVFDLQGKILVRYPEFETWVGQDVPESGLVRSVNDAGTSDGFVTTAGLDGIERLYYFDSLQPAGKSREAFLTIGYPVEYLSRDAQRILIQNTASLAGVSVISLAVAWLISSSFIADRFRLLEETNRYKSQFVSLVAHQLKTPVNAVLWGLELVLDESKSALSKDYQEMLDSTYSSSQHMLKLIDQLLNLSRIESGRLKVVPEPTDINALVEESIKELTPRIEAKQHSITTSFEDLPKLTVDPLLIREVITNLVSNAVKYTPDKGSVTVQTEQQKGFVKVSVTDSGMGIPLEEQPKLFELFYRASNTRDNEIEGNGLGLYFVRKLVEISGGEIGFSSDEGNGSTFWFTLPLRGSAAREGEVRIG